MERVVNPGLAQYMKAVDAAAKAVCGVAYMEIYSDLHGDLSAMKDCYGEGVPAEAFVERLVASERLVRVTDPLRGDQARDLNLRLAALQAFWQENQDWLRGADGSLFKATENRELFRMRPGRSNDGSSWGFVVEEIFNGVPTLDEDCLVSINEDAHFERVGGGMDISDAVNAYEHRLNASHGFGLH